MSPETYQAIQKCKLHILNKEHSAFISSMLYNLNIVDAPVETVQLVTSETSNQILLNSNWFTNFSTEEQASILVHEVLHYALQHDLRRGQRNPSSYQKACDQVVNNLLLQMGYELPAKEKNFTKYKYKNMAVEAVYKDIEEERLNNEKNNNNNNNQPNSSFGSDLNCQNFASNTQQNKRNQQVLSSDLANQAVGNKSIGNSGEVFSKLFEDIKSGKLDWKTILSAHVDEITLGGLSYSSFNRRYLPFGLYLPDNSSENTIHKIAVALDVSGSISEEQAKNLLAEVKRIRDDIEPENTSIMTFNHDIVDIFDIAAHDSFDSVKLRISGGTALESVFEYYNKPENQPKFLIVFSDLYCTPITEKPNFPVIWVCIDNPNAITNFGKLINITSEDLE